MGPQPTMSGPKKIRDSQKIVHFLRSELHNVTPTYSSSNNPKDLQLTLESPQVTNFTVNNSSHFTDYYLKSKDGTYERSLGDVEDLEKVYKVVRENLQVPRPKINIEKDTLAIEFEERVKNDIEYREKMLEEQRCARIVLEKKRTKSTVANQSTRANSKDHMNSSFTSQNRTLRELHEPNLADLEMINGRKKVGQYSVEVDRLVGNKISYQVFAILEKPQRPQDKPVKDVSQKEGIFRLLKEESQAEGLVISRPENENPFVKVLVKQHNPFKLDRHNTSLRKEETDGKTRIKRKWDIQGITSFSSQKTRKSHNKPTLALNDILGDCETRLKTTKANHSFTTQKEAPFVDTFMNLSVTQEYRNSVMDREYGFSLKRSSIVTPNFRLATLDERVEERNRIFGKANGKVKNIRIELEKQFDNYEKMSSRGLRLHRSSHRQTLVPRTLQKGGQSRSIKEDIIEVSDRKEIVKYQEQKNIDPYSTSGTFITQDELNKRKESINEQLNSAQALLTQSNEEDPKNANDITNTQRTQRTQSISQKENNVHPYGDQKGRRERTPSYDMDLSPVKSHSKGPRAFKVDNLSVEGIMERNDDEGFDGYQTTSKSSSRYGRFLKNVSRQNELTPSGVKRPNVMTPCNEIEDRLNKSFNDFMNVKAKADNKFKAVANMLAKDRPLINKIRHNKYDMNKVIANNIDRLRVEAETCRQEKFKESEEQRKLYLSLLDYIVNLEYNSTKLKACYYFMNVFKELLERGDKFTKENFNQLLNKIDDEKSITQIFLGVLARVIDLIKVKVEDIENNYIQNLLQKYMQESSRKRDLPRQDLVV